MNGRSVFPWSGEREAPSAVAGLVVVMDEGRMKRGKERRVGLWKDRERDLIMQEAVAIFSTCPLDLMEQC